VMAVIMMGFMWRMYKGGERRDRRGQRCRFRALPVARAKPGDSGRCQLYERNDSASFDRAKPVPDDAEELPPQRATPETATP
jgi:hypothetical protein